MRTRAWQIVGLSIGAILLLRTAQAQTILASQSIGGTEALTGNWSVAQNDADSYTYYYAANRSIYSDSAASIPQIIYAVSFDAAPVVSDDSPALTQTFMPAEHNSDLREDSWTPIDFEGNRARLVSEVESDLRGILGRPEAQDYYESSAAMLPHVSLSAYMDAAVPEPPTTRLMAIAALTLVSFNKINVLKRQYYRQLSPVSAKAPRR